MVDSDIEVPDDPGDWSEENIFQVALYQVTHKELLLTEELASQLHFLECDCNDQGVITITAPPHVHDWFASSASAQVALERLEQLTEKTIYLG